MLSNQDVSDGSKLVKDIKNFRLNHEGQGVYVFSPLYLFPQFSHEIEFSLTL